MLSGETEDATALLREVAIVNGHPDIADTISRCKIVENFVSNRGQAGLAVTSHGLASCFIR